MRVLVIGTGSIGRRHMASLRACEPGVSFDVLREPGRPHEAEGLGEVTVSRSVEEAYAKRPSLVVVANPSAFHLRHLAAAIEHGVPFYAEKPVVSSLGDLDALRQLARHATHMPPNIVGCNLRFLPSLQRLKRLVDEGTLGRIVRAGFEAGQWLPDWRPSQDYRQSYSARADMGGGVLLDLIHEIDAACWLLGDFPQVHGLTSRAAALDIDSEACASLLLGRPGGPLVSVQLDYVSRRPVRRYVLVGDRGTAQWNLQERTLTVSRADGVEAIEFEDDAFDVAATYPAAMRELLDAIRTGRATSQPLEEGLRALDIVMRARAPEPNR